MKEQQIEDRNWKIDQKNECLIIGLILLNSIEDRIFQHYKRYIK
jgi:SNF2 family DNA or RNA helicase